MNSVENRVIHFYPYKLFTVGEKQFLYTINASGIFEIDDTIKNVLQYNGKEINSIPHSSEIAGLLKMLYEEQLIYFDGGEYKSDINYKEQKISALTLMVVQECNMRCAYCYGEGGEYNKKGKMTFDVAKRAIDYLVKESDDEHLHIAFLGGEPLMNFKLIKEVITYCKSIEERGKKYFSYTMTTNATLLDEEIEKYLLENKVVCQISMDGVQEKHDKNRFFSGGTGSYNIILQKTKNMREKNLVTARATLSEENNNYIEVFEHLDALGFKAVPIAIAENMVSEEAFEIILENYKKYINYFDSLIKNEHYEKAKKMTDIISALEKLEYGGHREDGCGAGCRMHAVDIDGYMYPCHRFVGTDYVLGNAETGVDSNIFAKNILKMKNSSCKECWAQNLCLGGCPYENYVASGDAPSVSKRNCRLQKMLYEELMKVYVLLSDEEKKQLF